MRGVGDQKPIALISPNVSMLTRAKKRPDLRIRSEAPRVQSPLNRRDSLQFQYGVLPIGNYLISCFLLVPIVPYCSIRLKNVSGFLTYLQLARACKLLIIQIYLLGMISA